MIEEWKIAVGTDGRYEVSNIGRVRRFDGVMLSVSVPKNARSYPAAMMRYGGKRVRRAVHRLVAINFISPPPFDGAEVRHLDGNHMNPRLDNLAWGTRTDNAADREAHGRTARGATHGKLGVGVYGERNGNYRVTPEMKRAACELVRSGKTQRQAAAEIGITQKSVWQAVRAIAWRILMTSTEWNAAIDAALAKVREQRAVFSSDAYATPQPIGGFMERFACNSIEVEIEALRKPDTPPTPAAEETAWLLERDYFGQLRYFSAACQDEAPTDWTPDNLQALRFARRIDAERFASREATDCIDIRVVEHMWCAIEHGSGK